MRFTTNHSEGWHSLHLWPYCTSRMWCKRVMRLLFALVSVSFNRELILNPSAFPVWLPWQKGKTKSNKNSQNEELRHCKYRKQKVSKVLQSIMTLCCSETDDIFQVYMNKFSQSVVTDAIFLTYRYRFSLHSWGSFQHQGWACRNWAAVNFSWDLRGDTHFTDFTL